MVTMAVGMSLTLGLAAIIPAGAAEETGPLDLEAELSDLIGLQYGGGVALSVHDGQTTSAAVGFADAAGDPMTLDSGFRIGWFGMQFVAAVVLQLVDEGRVDLDAPLTTYLPDVPLGGDATIRELLMQQTRLSNDLPELISRYVQDPDHLWTIDEIIEVAAEVARSEGTRVEQLGPTEYHLLIKLVEVLDGPFGEVFDRRIAEPLGLQGTSYPGSRLPDGLAAGWYPDLGVQGQPDIGGLDRISAFRTTGPDLVRFIQGLLGGEIVSSDLVAEVFSDQAGPITLGAFFLPDMMDYPGKRFFGTVGGDFTGYSFEIVVDPESGDIAIVLTNDGYIDPHPVAVSIVDSWEAASG
jgi:D-alanyl-D-alanine carboxypeptidase